MTIIVSVAQINSYTEFLIGIFHHRPLSNPVHVQHHLAYNDLSSIMSCVIMPLKRFQTLCNKPMRYCNNHKKIPTVRCKQKYWILNSGPGCTKSLPEPMLQSQYQDSVAFTWDKFHGEYPNCQYVWLILKSYSNITATTPMKRIVNNAHQNVVCKSFVRNVFD